MLELVIPETEQYDEANDRFITTKKQVLRLEHSLVSLSNGNRNGISPTFPESLRRGRSGSTISGA